MIFRRKHIRQNIVPVASFKFLQKGFKETILNIASSNWIIEKSNKNIKSVLIAFMTFLLKLKRSKQDKMLSKVRALTFWQETKWIHLLNRWIVTKTFKKQYVVKTHGYYSTNAISKTFWLHWVNYWSCSRADNTWVNSHFVAERKENNSICYQHRLKRTQWIRSSTP